MSQVRLSIFNSFLNPKLFTLFSASLPFHLSQMDVDEPVCLPRLSRVAVCGGTHGNELSGVYLVKELLKLQRRPSEDDDEEPTSLLTVLSNPRAVQQGRRYTDTDLNRCFTLATLK